MRKSEILILSFFAKVYETVRVCVFVCVCGGGGGGTVGYFIKCSAKIDF